MDQTEEIEKIRKKIFNIQLKMAMENDPDKILEEGAEVQKLQRILEALEKEKLDMGGQIGFAFTDLIADTKLEIKKGR